MTCTFMVNNMGTTHTKHIVKLYTSYFCIHLCILSWGTVSCWGHSMRDDTGPRDTEIIGEWSYVPIPIVSILPIVTLLGFAYT